MFTVKLGIDRERSVTETLSAFIVNFVLTGFQHMKHLAYFTIVNYPLDIRSIHKHNIQCDSTRWFFPQLDHFNNI